MYPILARYGPFFLYSYTVMMGLGLGVAIGMTAWLARQKGWKGTDWLDTLLIMMAAAIAGGRIVFVLTRLEYFQVESGEIGLFWRGGLSYHGALVSGLLAVWLWYRWNEQPLLPVLGLLTPGLAVASVFGWAACLLEGCAFGREASIGPLAADLPDYFGVQGLRYQTQLLGILLSLPAFMLALWLQRRAVPGATFWITLATLSAGRVAVGLLRGDPGPELGNIRLDILAEGALIAISMTAIIAMRRSGNKIRNRI